MAGRKARASDLSRYPEDASFQTLLNWHLDWGTRPHCDKSRRNWKWIRANFAALVHPAGTELPHASRSLRYWTNEGVLPDENDAEKLAGIFRELFGDDPNLADWKADLQRALERDRAAKPKGGAPAKPLIPAVRVPRPTSHFVGRDDEVDSLAATLAAGSDLAVLLQGGPGIGKTELTKAIANDSRVVERFGERRWFVSLETAATNAAMQEAVARGVGSEPAHGFDAALAVLHKGRSLLILDNLETPWELPAERRATEETLAALASLVGVSVLASFRGRDSLGGPSWTPHFVGALPHQPSSELFGRIAGGWVLDDPFLDTFIDVLGGVPLAIALIARRAYGRSSLEPLWQEWIKVGDELAVDPDFAGARLTSLPHSIELSLRSPRMTPDALRLFALLGDLPAGLSREDLDALLGEAGFDAEDRLLRSGLIVERPGRIDLLPPVREHARHHRTTGEADTKWIGHYLEMAKRGRRIGFEDGVRLVETLDREIYNIQEALRRYEHRRGDAFPMDALSGFVKLAKFRGSKTDILDVYIDKFLETQDVANEAMCRQWRAGAFMTSGDFQSALLDAQRALTIKESLGDRPGQAFCLELIGDIQMAHFAYSTAIESYERALAIHAGEGDLVGEANAIFGVADVLFRISRFAESTKKLASAIPKYQAAQDVLGEANCHQVNATVLVKLNDFEAARQSHETAISLYRRAGERRGEANSLFLMSELEKLEGQYDVAERLCLEAQQLYQQEGYARGMINCVSVQAEISLRRERYDEAHSGSLEALSRFEALGDLVGQGISWIRLGEVALARGEFDAATTSQGKALEIFRSVGDGSAEAECLLHLGAICVAQANYQDAVSYYEQSLGVCRSNNDVAGQALSAERIGDAYISAGSTDAATPHYRSAIEFYRAINDSKGAERCLSKAPVRDQA